MHAIEKRYLIYSRVKNSKECMTKKEITKKLLKNETCNNCKYCSFVKQCVKDEKKTLDLPKEQTCKCFERGQWSRKLKVTWTQQAYQDLKFYNATRQKDVEEKLTPVKK